MIKQTNRPRHIIRAPAFIAGLQVNSICDHRHRHGCCRSSLPPQDKYKSNEKRKSGEKITLSRGLVLISSGIAGSWTDPKQTLSRRRSLGNYQCFVRVWYNWCNTDLDIYHWQLVSSHLSSLTRTCIIDTDHATMLQNFLMYVPKRSSKYPIRSVEQC